MSQFLKQQQPMTYSKRGIATFPRSAQFQVKRVWCGGKCDYWGLWVKNTHPESFCCCFCCCCCCRMTESVGRNVGALKPQQVGKYDRFTSPSSYRPDILSPSRDTATQRDKQTHGTPQQASFTFSMTDSTYENNRGKEYLNVTICQDV